MLQGESSASPCGLEAFVDCNLTAFWYETRISGGIHRHALDIEHKPGEETRYRLCGTRYRHRVWAGLGVLCHGGTIHASYHSCASRAYLSLQAAGLSATDSYIQGIKCSSDTCRLCTFAHSFDRY